MRRARRAAATVLAVAVSLAACGEDDTARLGSAATAAPATEPSATPVATPAPAPSPRPPKPVDLPPLPPAGIALDRGRGVSLLDLSGRVLVKLEGYEIQGNPGAPGVWLRRGPGFFRLRAGAGALQPVSRRSAESSYDEGDEPRLRPPRGAWTNGIGISGHWRYALERGDGVVLAQWSDECEVPFAFWKEPGRRAVSVTGERDYWDSPESVALGWSPDGAAIVLLGEGLCGNPGNPPGIYTFTAPGDGTLLFEMRHRGPADMW